MCAGRASAKSVAEKCCQMEEETVVPMTPVVALVSPFANGLCCVDVLSEAVFEIWVQLISPA